MKVICITNLEPIELTPDLTVRVSKEDTNKSFLHKGLTVGKWQVV
jgi:hypothetical protein